MDEAHARLLIYQTQCCGGVTVCHPQVISHMRQYFCSELTDGTDRHLLFSPKQRGKNQVAHFYAEFKGTRLYLQDMPGSTAEVTLALAQAIILALCRSDMMTQIASNPGVFAMFANRLKTIQATSEITQSILRLCKSEFSVIDDLIRKRMYKHTHKHTHTNTKAPAICDYALLDVVHYRRTHITHIRTHKLTHTFSETYTMIVV
jgi:hypothetical protein